MKNTLMSGAIMVGIALLAIGAFADQGMIISRTAQPPAVDGRADAPCWRDAQCTVWRRGF